MRVLDSISQKIHCKRETEKSRKNTKLVGITYNSFVDEMED